ncbi:SRPBCC family protein [uncultured Tateyamaria sp.]|uniref:SRPBCC family protein n=1 Tax=uncultured Tateyamaria sp. TaxID=455651 RepID=UPI002637FF16|nr:SRPBCC family protein [uncultured Tateyamaria sp.]
MDIDTDSGPKAVVTGTAQGALAEVWDRFVPIKLPEVFPNPKGPIPAVVAVEDQDGRWDTVGKSRTVVLADGMRVREEITHSDPTGGQPAQAIAQFGYTVSGFTGPLSWLVSEAQGHWLFEDKGAHTRITWTYQFRPTHALARPLAKAIIALFWQRYMNEGMQNVTRITGQSSTQTASGSVTPRTS